MRAHGNVLAHAEAGKRAHDLEGARDTALRAPVRRQRADIVPFKYDAPLVGVSKPEIKPNKVVLPAPLGPIKPVMPTPSR
jgi:hypothetical protein